MSDEHKDDLWRDFPKTAVAFDVAIGPRVLRCGPHPSQIGSRNLMAQYVLPKQLRACGAPRSLHSLGPR